MSHPMIEIEGLDKRYEAPQATAAHVLHDITLSIEMGELVILKGVSGSGKSTLLSIIGALSRPTRGRVVVDGENIAKLPDLHASAFRASTIGFVFQSFDLFEELDVEDNVSLPLINSALSRAFIDRRAADAMALAHITHKRRQRVRDLSGGEKQRCAIARALVNDPKIVLCDEPTANLDRDNALRFIETLRSLKTMGKTVVVATHDPLFEASGIADRVILMEDGRVKG